MRTLPQDGRRSTQGIPEVEKRLESTGSTSSSSGRKAAKHRTTTTCITPPARTAAKMSSLSLHAVPVRTGDGDADSGGDSGEESAPLQRRNSIHNVPYVDVNDPETRSRMERYKEERRSLLRARYKAEDYLSSDFAAGSRKKKLSASGSSQESAADGGPGGSEEGGGGVDQLQQQQQPAVDPAIREEIRDQVIRQEIKQMVRTATEQQPWQQQPTSGSSRTLPEGSPAMNNASPAAVHGRQKKPEEVRKLVDLRPAPPPTFLSAASTAARKSTDENGLLLQQQQRHGTNSSRSSSGETMSGYGANASTTLSQVTKVVSGTSVPSSSNTMFLSATTKRTVSVSGGGGTHTPALLEKQQLSSQQQQLPTSEVNAGNSNPTSGGRINFGHIDESVNVKERASRFGAQQQQQQNNNTSKQADPMSTSAANTPTAAAQQSKMRALSVGSSGGAGLAAVTSERKSAAMDSDRLLRKFSAPIGGGATSHSGAAATSPNKIKNMTAIFEQKH